MARREPSIGQTRSNIAWTIVLVGFVGITAISGLAIGFATDQDRPEVTQTIFTAVLPLISTWVGAVLAFYFSKDNLQAATQTTLDAVASARGITAETPVMDAMIPINRIRPQRDVRNERAAKALKLSGLYESMQTSGMSRVPVFVDGVALYVVHEPDIDQYAQRIAVKSADLEESHTLGSLIEIPAGSKAVTTFATVAESATVADARATLKKMAQAKDVFVTEDGTKGGKVLGWLTNSDLARSE